MDVNFDSLRAGTYTESQVEEDFGDIRFTNGVDEGWVQVVRGAQAFGGTGASLRVFYPAGGEGPRGGGAQWISEFDEGMEEAYLSYRVKFGSGFDFVRGGKLPGMAGGSAPSGSAPADGVRGWSGRLMWRTDFTGETGEPEQLTSGLISYAKHVHSGFAMDGRQEDEEFLNEADGSQTTLLPDVWYEIRQRIVLNTLGQRDGIQQLWIDDRLGFDRRDYQWRDTANLKLDRFFFSTFFLVVVSFGVPARTKSSSLMTSKCRDRRNDWYPKTTLLQRQHLRQPIRETPSCLVQQLGSLISTSISLSPFEDAALPN